tara:strand:- start:6 stop:230 length:225 start_codon:yes stop_codon:yes gene_type:complete
MSNNIKHYIKKNGLQNTYIAQQLGCHRTEISQWIAGKRKPSRDRLKKLARILRCRMQDLIENIEFKVTYEVKED